MSQTTTFDIDRPDLTIGIIGAGIMGQGIAQIAAEAGITVLLADARAGACTEARGFVADMFARKATKGRMTEAEATAATNRIQVTEAGPDAGYAAFAGCHVVIEAVAERMDIKHAVLAGVEASVSETCIIATNTSSLSVTGFAAAAKHPERIAGFHFFNPVPLMRIVEVIGGVLTEEWVTTGLTSLARRLGHRPVNATDTPGFLVNHAGRAFGTEALRIVGEGVASFADVDRVMTEAAGFRMGPFQLLDLTGLDVSHTVIESIYHQYYQEPRYRPSPITAQRQAAGLYGRKVGRGFYVYTDGKPDMGPEQTVPPLAALPVWLAPDTRRLADVVRAAGATIVATPTADGLCLVTPWGADATTTALDLGLDPTRVVAVDMLFDLQGRRTAMTTPVTTAACRDAAHALLAADGSPVTMINDSPGFIAQRIVAGIVNVGCDIAQQRIAAPDDINVAVEMGLGYPRGSLRFGDELGPRRILSILEAIQAFTGDPRYRPSPWLKRRALLDVPLTTVEGSR